MKYLALLIFSTCFNFFVLSQGSLDEFIELVKQNNKTLKLSESRYKLEVASSNTNLTPDNPEIEIGYLLGNPEDIGNRTDFSISQSFDFPTSYLHKRRVSKVHKEKAKYNRSIIEQDVLIKAKKAWLNQVYWNRFQKIFSSRISFAEELDEQYERKFKLGEISKIDLNRINLRISLLKNEYNKAKLQGEICHSVIFELSGDSSFIVTDTVFPANLVINQDSIKKMYQNNPSMNYLKENIQLKKHESKLVFSEKLPKINIGYYSERVATESFKGAKIGFSIPVWENRNRQKKAQVEVLLAEAELENYNNSQNSTVMQLILQKHNLKQRKNELAESVNEINNLYLLRKALVSGEISISEYYFESDHYFRAMIELLEIEKEELMVEYELLKIVE